jgi:hypothetical protein
MVAGEIDSVTRREDARSPAAPRDSLGRGVMVAVWLTIGLILLAAGAFLWIRHNVNATGHAAQNPAGFAHSAPVRRADAADARWLDQQFTRLEGTAPWLSPAGRSVFDVCSADGSAGSLFGGGGARFSFSCQRVDSRYFAFSGPVSARIRQLRRSLGEAGWTAFESAGSAGASPLPVIGAGVAGQDDPPAGTAVLQLSWAQGGSQVDLQRDIGAVPRLVAPQRNTYLAAIRPGLTAVLGHLTSQHPHLLVVSVAARYAVKNLTHS